MFLSCAASTSRLSAPETDRRALSTAQQVEGASKGMSRVTALACAAFAVLLSSLPACRAPDAEPAVDTSADRPFAGDVDAACGQCRLGMPPPGCDLAVFISGRAYFVDGSRIDEHGDAHADDGFCNAIRRAYVSGHIEGDRFLATEFMLLPEPPRAIQRAP